MNFCKINNWNQSQLSYSSSKIPYGWLLSRASTPIERVPYYSPTQLKPSLFSNLTHSYITNKNSVSPARSRARIQHNSDFLPLGIKNKLFSSSTIQCKSVQYSTPQHNTVQFSTIPYTSAQYSAIQYNTVHFSTIQCNSAQYSAIQYNPVHLSTIQCNSVQYSTHQHNTVQFSTIQCNSVQYSTPQHNTVQFGTIQYNRRTNNTWL